MFIVVTTIVHMPADLWGPAQSFHVIAQASYQHFQSITRYTFYMYLQAKSLSRLNFTNHFSELPVGLLLVMQTKPSGRET